MGFSARKLSAFDVRNQIICNNIEINTSSFSLNTSGNAIALNRTIQIPGEQQQEPVIQVFSLNGSFWDQVGSDILRPQDSENILSWGENIKINSNGNVIVFNYMQRIQSVPLLVQSKTRALTWNGSNWIQLGSDIVSPQSKISSFIQMSVNSNCDRLFICVRYQPDSTYIDKNSVFSWNGSSWNQLGGDISGVNVVGISMNSIGDRIAVSLGAPDANTWYGALKAFSFNGSSWTQTGTTITGIDNVRYDESANSIALNSSGNILASGYLTQNNQKYVRFFSFNGSNWIQIREDLNMYSNVDVNSSWRSGISLISNGNAIMYYDSNSFSSEKAILVYYWNNFRWVRLFGVSDTGSNLTIPLKVPTPNSLENYISYIKNSKIIAFRLLNK